MGKNKRDHKKRQFQPSGLGLTGAELMASFRKMVNCLRCPHCDVEFTDFAIEWGDAWEEGRRDLMVEVDMQERDGPYKLKCELCGRRSWLNYFAPSVESAENIDNGQAPANET